MADINKTGDYNSVIQNTDKIEVKDKLKRTPPPTRPSRSLQKQSSKSNVSNNQKVPSASTFRSTSLPRSSSTSSLKKRKMGDDSPISQTQVKSRIDTSQSQVNSTSDTNISQVNSLTDTNNESRDSRCADCEKLFDKDDSCVYCDCCDRCFHAACQGVSEEKVTALKILANTAYYYCHNCDAGAKELYKMNVVLRNRIDGIEKTVSELTSDHSTTKSKVKSLRSDHDRLANKVSTNTESVKSVQTKCKNNKTDIDMLKGNQTANDVKFNAITERLNAIEPNLKKQLDEMINTTVDDKLKKFKDDNQIAANTSDQSNVTNIVDKLVVEKFNTLKDENFPTPITMEVDGEGASNARITQSELENKMNDIYTERLEIEKRRNQLIIMNFKENQNSANDIKELNELFGMLKVNDELIIEHADRLGEKRRDGKPRFLRVDMKTVHMKRKILEKATTLRDVPDDHKFNKVFIKPNLTKTQQAQSKNLQAQLLKERDRNPGTNMKIYRGKIIVVPSTN